MMLNTMLVTLGNAFCLLSNHTKQTTGMAE